MNPQIPVIDLFSGENKCLPNAWSEKSVDGVSTLLHLRSLSGRISLDLLLVALERSGHLLGHVLLVMLRENLRRPEEADAVPGLLRHGRSPRRALRVGLPLSVRLEPLQETFDDCGMPLAEQIGQRALVPDEDVRHQIGDHELHLRRGCRRVHDAALHDETPQPEAVLRGVRDEFLDGFAGGDVEDQLILEIVEHDDDEARDAAEGEGVRPQPPVLELPRSRRNVDGLRPRRLPAERGEVSEEDAAAWSGGGNRRRGGPVQGRGRGGAVMESGGTQGGGEARAEAAAGKPAGHGQPAEQ